MIVTAGKTNVSVYFYIVQDASNTSPGEPVTGLLFSDIETGGSASFVRQGAARVDLTLITLASASATHADGGFILVDDTNMPGVYRCDYADATFLTGVDEVTLSLVVASGKNAVAAPLKVQIVDMDFRDSVRGGMTALPNAAADGAFGLPISDAGGLALDTILDAAITTRLAPTTASRTLDILATGEVAANLTMMGGGTQSATDLKDFADAGYNPATNKVTGVLLVDTTTANSDLVTAAAVNTAVEGGQVGTDTTALLDNITSGVSIHAGTHSAVTIQGVLRSIANTLTDTVTANSDLVTAAAVNTAVEGGQVGSDTGNILTDTANMQPKFGTIVDLGSGANIGSNLSNLAGPTFAPDTDSQENIRNDIAGLNNIDGSGVTLHAGTHSGATISGVLEAGTASGVTLHAGTHANVVIPTVTLVTTTTTNTDLVSAAAVNTAVEAGQVGTDTGNIITDIAALNDIDGSGVTLHAGTHSSVTIQGVSNNIVTQLATDTVDAVALADDAVTEIWAKTVAELSQGAPSATPTALNALALISMGLRNKVESSSTQKTFFNDAGTVIWKKALADDGTTYTESEGATGP